MKRRRFIQASLLTTALPVAASGERLYGTPASLLPNGERIADKFLLPLSQTGLPPSTWREFSSVCEVIENVLASNVESAIFFKDPKKYMAERGLDASDKTLMDDSVIMLTCLSNAGVRESFAKRDYESVLEYFRVAGLFEPRDPSVLGQKIEQLVAANAGEIRKLMGSDSVKLRPDQERILLDVLEQSGVRLTEDDFAIVSELVSNGVVSPQACSAVAACVVAVAIVAIAAAYVSVTVGATVALMAGFTVSIAIQLAVFGPRPPTHPQLTTSSEDAPFTGALAKLDPVLMRNTERAIRMSAITGDDGLRLHVLKDLIRDEVEAFMRAMQKTELLPVDDEHLRLATKATTAYAYRVIGI